MQPISTAFFRTPPFPNNSLQPTQSVEDLFMKNEKREEKNSQADQRKINPEFII